MFWIVKKDYGKYSEKKIMNFNYMISWVLLYYILNFSGPLLVWLQILIGVSVFDHVNINSFSGSL